MEADYDSRPCYDRQFCPVFLLGLWKWDICSFPGNLVVIFLIEG